MTNSYIKVKLSALPKKDSGHLRVDACKRLVARRLSMSLRNGFENLRFDYFVCLISAPKHARLLAGLTQSELVDEASIHANTYAKIERDDQDPSLTTAKKLAKVLKLDLNTLPD